MQIRRGGGGQSHAQCMIGMGTLRGMNQQCMLETALTTSGGHDYKKACTLGVKALKFTPRSAVYQYRWISEGIFETSACKLMASLSFRPCVADTSCSTQHLSSILWTHLIVLKSCSAVTLHGWKKGPADDKLSLTGRSACSLCITADQANGKRAHSEPGAVSKRISLLTQDLTCSTQSCC